MTWRALIARALDRTADWLFQPGDWLIRAAYQLDPDNDLVVAVTEDGAITRT
jgi:hypothetical protein